MIPSRCIAAVFLSPDFVLYDNNLIVEGDIIYR